MGPDEGHGCDTFDAKRVLDLRAGPEDPVGELAESRDGEAARRRQRAIAATSKNLGLLGASGGEASVIRRDSVTGNDCCCTETM